MLKRTIPSSGEAVGAIGLGTWQVFDVAEDASARAPLAEVVEALFQAGGRLIDSSPMYGRAEQVAGDLLAGAQDRPFLATKVWTTGKERGLAQMERSFELLRTKTIDLMQIHNLVDWRTHLPTLRSWKDEGRIRYIGITHYTASAHEALCAVMREARPDFVQVNYALDDRDADRTVLPLAQDLGIAVLVNRPFGEGGLLRRIAGRPLPDVARELGVSGWPELALKFILGHPAVTAAIPATSRPEHIRANASAGTGPIPDARQRAAIIASLAG